MRRARPHRPPCAASAGPPPPPPPLPPPLPRCLSTCPRRWGPLRQRRLGWSTCCVMSRMPPCPPWPQRWGVAGRAAGGHRGGWGRLQGLHAGQAAAARPARSRSAVAPTTRLLRCPFHPACQVGDMVTGLRGLKSRLEEVRQYLEAVVAGRLPVNHDIMRNLQVCGGARWGACGGGGGSAMASVQTQPARAARPDSAYPATRTPPPTPTTGHLQPAAQPECCGAVAQLCGGVQRHDARPLPRLPRPLRARPARPHRQQAGPPVLGAREGGWAAGRGGSRRRLAAEAGKAVTQAVRSIGKQRPWIHRAHHSPPPYTIHSKPRRRRPKRRRRGAARRRSTGRRRPQQATPRPTRRMVQMHRSSGGLSACPVAPAAHVCRTCNNSTAGDVGWQHMGIAAHGNRGACAPQGRPPRSNLPLLSQPPHTR